MEHINHTAPLCFFMTTHTMNYYLNIGSNIGNRQGNISQAIDLINSTFKTSVRCSSPVESEPWGFDSGNTFVNEGIVLRTDRAPHDVLTALQRVERSISDTSHRNADGSYRDRIIDIDIVAIDHLVIDSPTLKVPHPHFAERDFYIIPMQELAPTWTHPRTHLTPCQMLNKLTAGAAAR